jgi:hypothetical protein
MIVTSTIEFMKLSPIPQSAMITSMASEPAMTGNMA